MSKAKQTARAIRVAVIGAGMSGVLAAIRLRQQGLDFVVFEKANRVGGTWRENTYPGLACDVPAHWYTYSFARNPEWGSLLAAGPEIFDYFQRMSRQFDVEQKIRFGDEVMKLEYLDGRWTVTTASGHQDRFDVVIAATGVLHHPNIPKFDGLETFKGAVFHSARWDHDVPVDGKRIGVVGTGSTAAQITAALVPRASKFTLFQRTAQWVMPRPNIVYSEDEKATFRADPAALERLVQQYRTRTIEGYATAVLDYDSPELAEIQRLCSENLATVRDPELRARLTPGYRAACKRLVISSEFYPAIQQPNAELVTAGIQRIESEGVRTDDGVLHELDLLVLATGFHTDRFVRPAKVYGRGGIDLDKVWADAPVAYLAVTVPEFPNFFMLGGPNSPVGNFSLIEVCEHQLAYILRLIDGLSAGDYGEVSATQAALDRFETERQEAAKRTVWVTGCNSWYLDKQGVPASWTFTYGRFVDEMATPKMHDFETR
ncbi:NAD(P)/FAD-dependent oxidoreductase [Phenylobacterium sp.]|uniref:flavin-containing monooxygenase n=1 Tax=Phenylobacterium sp. TaxID=1871053 RepID=UPI0025F1ABA3|nr:NAD(P)/FAD-dependent oxidoreductase [Phenylobacterium sp.]